jgi:hypothetical protein
MMVATTSDAPTLGQFEATDFLSAELERAKPGIRTLF